MKSITPHRPPYTPNLDGNGVARGIYDDDDDGLATITMQQQND